MSRRNSAVACVMAIVAACATARAVAQVPARGLAADPNGVERGTVPVDGGELYYEAKGDGPTVILLHGGLLDVRMWNEQFDLLARDYRAIRYDARGAGRSSIPAGDYSHYEDLHALMTALGLKRATLVGLSQGARTAIDFAIKYPRMVEGVVAVAPGMSGWQFKDWASLGQMRAVQETLAANDVPACAEAFVRAWTDGPKRTPDAVDKAVRDRVKEMVAQNLTRALAARGQVQEIGAAARLRDLDGRVRIVAIVGDQDSADIQAIAHALAKRAGAKKLLVPGAGHMVNLERPDRFNALLLGFLDGKQTDSFNEMPHERLLRGVPAVRIVN